MDACFLRKATSTRNEYLESCQIIVLNMVDFDKKDAASNIKITTFSVVFQVYRVYMHDLPKVNLRAKNRLLKKNGRKHTTIIRETN